MFYKSSALLAFLLSIITISVFAQNPNIKASVNQLYSFRQLYVNTMSDVQFYEVEAESLTSDLTISVNAPFKISLDCYEHFKNEIIIPHHNGYINQRIFVRAFAEATGQFNESIIHSSDNAGTVNVNVSITGIQPHVPSNYYSTATTGGSTLKTQLHSIINGHNVQAYSSLWTHFVSTDAAFSGKVWDMYSNIPCDDPPYVYTFFDDQDTGTGGNIEGDFYNREHSFPRSWFGGSVNPMHTDLHHIYPVDKWVNNFKAAYPLAIITSPTGTSLNGCKRGNISVDGYNGLAFEIIDEYKGDLARTFFYMITRYEDQIAGWSFSDEGMAMLDNQKYPGYKEWAIEMLIEWHELDPVSQKERARNDAVYAIQGNRNPFIDHPEFVNRIWGDTTDLGNGTSILRGVNNTLYVYPNPTSGIVFYESDIKMDYIEAYNVNGILARKIYPEAESNNIYLSGLPAGVYYVRFISDNNISIKKVVLVNPD